MTPSQENEPYSSPKRITLFIKSPNIETAKEEAKLRQISLTDLCEINPNEIRARTNETNFIKVQKWYYEEWRNGNWETQGHGFTTGTLLFFNLDKGD